jgi:ADYC domain
MRTRIALSLLVAGCASQSDPSFDDRASETLVVTNGENLNGENLNGENLNGENLNGPGLGVNVSYVSFSGASLDDNKQLDSAWLGGTVFYGTSAGHGYSGLDFDGAQFTAVTLDGSPVALRVRHPSNAPPPDDDVWTYLVDFRNSSGTWQPLCRGASGAAVAAIPLMGRWNYGRGVPGGGSKIDDPDAFTFACTGLGAIAKCVLPIGYKPWKTVGGTSLAAMHQACVRLIRADYCGDGSPWTKDGRTVDVYDALAIQRDTDPWWLFEAEWTSAGARCVSTYRVIDLKNILGIVPSCILGKVSLTCGARSHFASGTLLMNRYRFPSISLF